MITPPFKVILFILMIPAFIFSIGVESAKADLFVSPLRIVFEGRDRSAVVTLINTSNKTNIYRIGWKLYKVNIYGGYDAITDDDNSVTAVRARKMEKTIRYSPRQVTIEPGGKQRIRLSLRRDAEMEDGDYRAHLNFSKLPDMSDISDKKTKGVSMMLYAQLSFTIPVIVRQGKRDVEVSIDKITFIPASEDQNNKFSLKLVLNRTGLHSAYGRLLVFWTPKNGGKEKQIGILNNVSIYSEVNKREIRLPLTVNSVGSGDIRVVYQGDGEYKGTIWDEKTFKVK